MIISIEPEFIVPKSKSANFRIRLKWISKTNWLAPLVFFLYSPCIVAKSFRMRLRCIVCASGKEKHAKNYSMGDNVKSLYLMMISMLRRRFDSHKKSDAAFMAIKMNIYLDLVKFHSANWSILKYFWFISFSYKFIVDTLNFWIEKNKWILTMATK